ncbi:MAG: helicase HerA-like domain-containing protein [Robiginitomaculum sp.]
MRAAASSFRENPAFDTEDVITDLGIGEALVSLLDKKGVPGIVGRTLIRPPASRLGPALKKERKAIMDDSPVKGVYDETIDRESAYEILEAKHAAAEKEQAKLEKAQAKKKASPRKKSTRTKSSGGGLGKATKREIARATRQVGRTVGRELVRGILGAIMRR